MRRGRLQLLTLIAWTAGLILLESTVFIADGQSIDSYAITRDKVTKFQLEFGRRFNNYSALVSGVAIGLDPLVGETIEDVRTQPAFKSYLKRHLPAPTTAEMVDWLVKRGAEGKVRSYYLSLLELYLPWLAIMLGGVFKEHGLNGLVPREKVAVSLSFSAGLQLLFLVVLVFNLWKGQIGSTVNVQPIVVLAASVVGVLVQFVFPSSPEPT